MLLKVKNTTNVNQHFLHPTEIDENNIRNFFDNIFIYFYYNLLRLNI